MSRLHHLLLLVPALTACPSDSKLPEDEPGSTSHAETGNAEAGEPTTTGGEPVTIPAGECDHGPDAPTRLALVTNNFIDPAALHVVDLEAREITADVAPATTDPALAWGGGMLALLGRSTFNSLDVLDGADWSSVAALPVAVDGVDNPNPQALAFAADGRAYLTLMASSAVPIFDFTLDPGENPVGALDLAAFADDDGSPEAGVALACGDVLFIGIQRLDPAFTPVDHSYLVPVDLTTAAPIDLDPAQDGPQAIQLLGPWPKQIRRDPADETGHTVLVLTSGVERVDLTTGAVSWAVSPERLAALEIEGYDPQNFVAAADGASIYLTATDGAFPAAAVHQIGLADDSATTVLTGLQSTDKMLERAGDTLWIGDANPDAPALRALDLTQSPPAELAPLPTPGAPYLLLALP